MGEKQTKLKNNIAIPRNKVKEFWGLEMEMDPQLKLQALEEFRLK